MNNKGSIRVILIISIIILLILMLIIFVILMKKDTSNIDLDNEKENTTESSDDVEIETNINEDIYNVNKYGWRVKNYNVKTNEFESGIWRLFYQDNEYAYLITDKSIGKYNLSNMYNQEYSKYVNGESVGKIGKKLNSKINSTFVKENKNANIRAISWLTDDEYWKYYKNNDAEYAIGTPTLELYINSFNKANKEYIEDLNTRYSKISLSSDNNGYKINDEKYGYIYDENRHGIYRIEDNNNWWLASPSTDKNIVYYLFGGDEYLSTNYGNGAWIQEGNVQNDSFAVRPVVCIPINIFKNKYEESLVND